MVEQVDSLGDRLCAMHASAGTPTRNACQPRCPSLHTHGTQHKEKWDSIKRNGAQHKRNWTQHIEKWGTA
eukprot:350841-Chlamydomonas_euryale.AAC.3